MEVDDEVEVDEDELDVLLLDDEEELENRLVDARIAADILLVLELEEPDDDEVELRPALEVIFAVGVVELLLDRLSRPNPERLPRSRGVTSEA